MPSVFGHEVIRIGLMRQAEKLHIRNITRHTAELGYELKRIGEIVTMPDGEVLTVTPEGEIVNVQGRRTATRNTPE